MWIALAAGFAALFATLLVLDVLARRVHLGPVAIERGDWPVRYWSILLFEGVCALMFVFAAFVLNAIPPACGDFPARPCTVTIEIPPQ